MSATEWREVELGDVIELHDSKRKPLSGKERSARQGKYPYYGASGVIDYLDDYMLDGSYLLISEDGENLNSRKLPIAFWARGKFWVNNHAHIILGKEGRANTDFIRHWLLQANISGYITGAAQPKLSQGNLCRIKLKIPEIETQNIISRVLSNYDNLIENNNRRIAILEDMAQSLYREWFVKFRFPGHENCQFKDSSLGRIPEGWGVKKLSEIAQVNPESITKKNAPEEINYIDIKSVTTGSIEEIKQMDFNGAPSRARRKVRHGDLIWATVRPNRKQYSFIARPRSNTVVSTGFAVLRASQVSPEYLYYAVTTDDFTSYLVNHATGAAYPAVNTKDFKGADILVPSESVMVSFDALVSNSISESQILKLKNNNLKQQRDILLPKLIPGKINI